MGVNVRADGEYRLGLTETDRHEAASENGEFELLGLSWDLLPGVFAPYHSHSTASYTRWLPLPPGGSLLEMGCGAGVTAVHAALHGCRRVVAADISAAAVRNTAVNAVRHGVADRVQAVESDMFAGIDPEERFDVVFWNSSAIPAPSDFTYSREIEWSIFDREYASHRAYLNQGRSRLAEGGRLFLGFNTNGDRDRLEEIAAEAGLRVEEFRSTTTTYGDGHTARFMLLELVPE